jgi:K+-sensing histidine kinase KdpD
MRNRAETIPQPASGRFDPIRRNRFMPVIRYGVAVVSVLVTCVLSSGLRDVFQGTPPALLFCAIIFSGWFGGFGPGLLASVLSITVIEMYFRSHFLTTHRGAPRTLRVLLSSS